MTECIITTRTITSRKWGRYRAVAWLTTRRRSNRFSESHQYIGPGGTIQTLNVLQLAAQNGLLPRSTNWTVNTSPFIGSRNPGPISGWRVSRDAVGRIGPAATPLLPKFGPMVSGRSPCQFLRHVTGRAESADVHIRAVTQEIERVSGCENDGWRSVTQAEQLERSGPALVYAAALAVGCGKDLGHGARSMEVDVRIQVLPMKLVHRFGVLRIDVAEADVLANDGAVLGLHQPVVAGMMRPRLGLFDQQLAQQPATV